MAINEDNWQPSRLIPTSGIGGADEAERRATSALLAVMSAVREFGQSITKPLGAPASWLSTFVEVEFELDGKVVRPDGVLRASRGSKTWTALVEVKTGTDVLQTEQVEKYLEVARANGFDAVLTISNEVPIAPGLHPTKVDKRKVRTVALHHLSWAEVITVAVQQRVHKGVADPDQAWILGELIRYLRYPKSGTEEFSDMGREWVAIRDAAANGTLRLNNDGLTETVENWERLISTASWSMTRELGADVSVVRSRSESDDPASRVAIGKQRLVDSGCFTAMLRVPASIGDLTVSADLRSNRISVSVDIDAPREGRQPTRVAWLVRQLKDAPDSLMVESWSQGTRTSRSELLSAVRTDPGLLVEDPRKDIRKFRITATAKMGTGRSSGRNSFVDSVIDTTWSFYSDVVQHLTAWSPKAPKARTDGLSATEAAGIDTRSELDSPAESQVGRQGMEPVSQPHSPPSWISPVWGITGSLSGLGRITKDDTSS